MHMQKLQALALSFAFAFGLHAADAPDAAPVEKKAEGDVLVNPTATPVRPSVLPAIDKNELLGHIQYLSSPELHGREAGTPDQQKAAEYIAAEFNRYGLEPYGDEKDGQRGYFQEFPIKVFKGAGKDAAFKFELGGKETVGEMKKDFVLIPAGYKPTKAGAGVVFAGYGIAAPEYNYDDFANLDLSGKWALILRYYPQEFNDKDKASFKKTEPGKHASLAEKVLKCSLRRAVGVMIVTGPAGREKEKDGELLGKGLSGIIGDFHVPVLQITQAMANQILAPSGKTLGDLQTAINKDLSNQSMAISDVKVAAVSDIEVVEKKTNNIIARLEGSDENLKRQCVIIGAHCDHVGMGYEGSLLGKEGVGKMHPGADDNASGTSGLLEIAQNIGSLQKDQRPKRTILCMAFSGEEKGLLGSAFYCEHPKMPLADTAAMLNLDMIGRSSDGGAQISGLGSSKMFKELVAQDSKDSTLKLHLGSAADGPSDHASFFRHNIPVLFFYTGTHADYHRPTDTWDKINAPIAVDTANLALKILLDLGNRAERPAFSKAGTGGYLGVGADESKIKTTVGFPVGEVASGSPAEMAGLKKGDLITAFNEQKLANAMDLYMSLTEYSPGDEIELDLKRGGESMKIKVGLGARKAKKN